LMTMIKTIQRTSGGFSSKSNFVGGTDVKAESIVQ
jgi:hypothetical protein